MHRIFGIGKPLFLLSHLKGASHLNEKENHDTSPPTAAGSHNDVANRSRRTSQLTETVMTKSNSLDYGERRELFFVSEGKRIVQVWRRVSCRAMLSLGCLGSKRRGPQSLGCQPTWGADFRVDSWGIPLERGGPHRNITLDGCCSCAVAGGEDCL